MEIIELEQIRKDFFGLGARGVEALTEVHRFVYRGTQLSIAARSTTGDRRAR
jgi:hypothetical protein